MSLFRQCDKIRFHPQLSKKSNILILPKTEFRDKILPKSYRPIALLSSLGKGLERLIARRLSFLALKYRILTKNQCSTTPLRSAVDLTTALSCDIQSTWDEKIVAGCITMDIKGDFDRIQRGSFYKKLREHGSKVLSAGFLHF